MSAHEFGQWQVFLAEENELEGLSFQHGALVKLITVVANGLLTHPQKRAWTADDFVHRPWQPPPAESPTAPDALKQSLRQMAQG